MCACVHVTDRLFRRPSMVPRVFLSARERRAGQHRVRNVSPPRLVWARDGRQSKGAMVHHVFTFRSLTTFLVGAACLPPRRRALPKRRVSTGPISQLGFLGRARPDTQGDKEIIHPAGGAAEVYHFTTM